MNPNQQNIFYDNYNMHRIVFPWWVIFPQGPWMYPPRPPGPPPGPGPWMPPGQPWMPPRPPRPQPR